jgi:hypothetical protein
MRIWSAYKHFDQIDDDLLLLEITFNKGKWLLYSIEDWDFIIMKERRRHFKQHSRPPTVTCLRCPFAKASTLNDLFNPLRTIQYP